MAAKILDVADSMVTALNAESFSQSFTSVRDYLYDLDLPTHSSLHVAVWPSSITTESHARHGVQRDISVFVRVAKKITATNAAARKSSIDPLMTLVEEISDFIEPTDTTDELAPDGASWVNTETGDIDFSQLDELNQFSVINTYTFRTFK